MVEHLPFQTPQDGKLSHNIARFARALRAAGLPVGSGRLIDAIKAVEAVGFSERRDFFWCLQACFFSKPEHLATFAQVFRLFWRDPRYLEHMMALMLPSVRGVSEERRAKSAEKRAAEALLDGVMRDAPELEENQESIIEIDASQTASNTEKLRNLDFEQMSITEIAQAKKMLERLRLPVRPMISRRTKPDFRGQKPDWNRTMREAMRFGGEIHSLRTKTARIRWPNLVVICDISGSMSQYSRMVLHFLHAISNQKGAGWAKVHGFTFGTRLTNITRHLNTKDVDAALAAAGAEAQDWDGGTRIGACIQAFNRDWSRRVLGQGAIVLLITDGLDRGDVEVLQKEMQRLHLSSRRLIWLNPLLRWDGFAPKARGISAMLPHVDSFRAGHSITTLEDLAAAITQNNDSGEKLRMLDAMKTVN